MDSAESSITEQYSSSSIFIQLHTNANSAATALNGMEWQPGWSTGKRPCFRAMGRSFWNPTAILSTPTVNLAAAAA